MKTVQFMFVLIVLALASPAVAIDLSAYKGAYPFDEIDGYTFFENPIVREAIDGAAGGGISDWIAELQVGTPIELQDDGLIAIACEQHNCPGNNAAVAISLSGSLIAVCLYSEDGEHDATAGKLRWISQRFDKEVENINDEGCPADASQFLDAYSRVLK